MANQTRKFGYVTKAGRHVHGNVLGQYATKNESQQLDDRFETYYSSSGLVEPLYNPETLARLMEINTYHYRACKTKARDTAGLGWSLESIGDTASDVNRDRLNTLFESLSPPLSATFDRAQLDYEAVGWGAVELVREGYAHDGPIATIAHVPAHTLRIHKDGNRFAQVRGNKKRWFRAVEADIDVHKDTGDVQSGVVLDANARATEIMYWFNYTPRSDYYGLPDVMPALGAIHGDLARRDYNIAFFDNFGVPAYAVFITGDFEEGDVDAESGMTELEQAIESHFQELAKNPHSTLVMAVPTRENGQKVEIKFVPLAVEVKEASFRLYRADNRDEVLAAHGVPPYRAGISETGSLGGSTATETTEIYKRSVIEPRQDTLEGLINRYIVRGAFGIEDWRFKLAEIDLTDEKHEMELQSVLVDKRAMTAAEMRTHWADRFGLDPNIVLPVETGPDFESVELALKSFQERVLTIAGRDSPNASRNGASTRT